MSAESSSHSATVPPLDGEDLSPRLERLRSLHSAWGVLAQSCLSSHAATIAETGRGLTERLTSIAKSRSDVSDAALTAIDTLLDEFEASIRGVAVGIPVSELRVGLKEYCASNRRGLTDLLDVLISSRDELSQSIQERIHTLDYLITLLCTRPDSSPGVIGFDPVTLTPRLERLSQSSDDPDDPLLAEVEAEFFAAANLDAESLREEIQLRTLRRRKTELGMSFFAPRILRAVVTYNAALFARVRDEIVDNTDWGQVEGFPGSQAPSTFVRCSAFSSAPLRAVAQAVRRRASGEQPQPTPTDRMAWALDFEYLADNEREALRNEELASANDPLGTAILIGLLSRSIAVLSIELQDAGLSPDEISEDWVDEIGLVFQQEINAAIADDAYKAACALSELKNKFLLAPLAEQHRVSKATERTVAPRPLTPVAATTATSSAAPTPASVQKRESARDLVKDALERQQKARSASVRALSWQQIPWSRIATGLVALAAVLALGVFLASRQNPDLDSMTPEQLAAVSPFLTEGERDGEGTGLSFVGRVDDRFLRLPPEQREVAAEEIVDRLRSHGVRQIMIYDRHRQIRIQAIGTQPTRIL